MTLQIIQRDDQYLLNYCTKYLARGNHYPDSPPIPTNPNLNRVSEAWRFPVITSYGEPKATESLDTLENEVTFIYRAENPISVGQVAVVGTFGKLYQPLPLEPIRFLGDATGYFALTVVLPVRHSYRYQFIIDEQVILDPINPQQVTLSNGKIWSQFFTDFYTHPSSFEYWELELLYRLTEHILPFRTQAGENFLNRFYNNLSSSQKSEMRVNEMDVTVGAVNFIDNIVSREEIHHLIDYKICLAEIDRVLRQRNPYVESWEVSTQLFLELYDEMANNNVNGWDYSKYNSPRYFLEQLRRHTITGAFSHPKYGGNAAGAGWAYLAERYDGDFDWQAALEKPLGKNEDYFG